MVIVTFVFVLAALAGIDAGEYAGDYIDYDDQSTWPELCLNGKLQSPIDLPTGLDMVKQKDSINTPSAASDTTVMVANDDDHAIKVAYYPGDANNTFTVPVIDQDTTILQTHLHWGGSEHTIGKKRFDVECHLVTARNDEQNGEVYTVFSRLFEIGTANPELEEMIHYHNITADSFSGFNLTALFPSTIKGVYQYNGSLTTPPCTEGVRWFVVAEPLTVSQEQIEALKHSLLVNHELESNYRNTQATNNRTILMYELNAATPVSHFSIGLVCLAWVLGQII